MGPVATGLVVAILLAFDSLFLLMLLGALPRFRDRVQERRSSRRISHDPLLLPELQRLAQQTKRALYENGQGTMLYLSRLFTAPDEALPNEILGHARLFEALRYLSETKSSWNRIHLVSVVRGIVDHFGVADSVLERVYRIVSRAEVDEASVAEWETFRERYNQLRGAWERYSEHMFGVIGLSASIPGQPARVLNPRRVRQAGER